MRQFVTLLILAAVAVGAWMYWPQIKAIVQGEGEKQQAEAPAQPPQGNPPVKTPPPTPQTPPAKTPASPVTSVEPSTPKPQRPTEPAEEPSKTKTAPPVPEKTPKPEPIKVEMHLEMARDAATNKVTFHGTTNLPEGVALTFTLLGRNRGSDSDAVLVGEGAPLNVFRTKEFTLADTAYRIEISMQWERQRQAALWFGPRGELLRGPLVERGPAAAPQVRAVGTFFTKAIAKAKDRVAIKLRPAESK